MAAYFFDSSALAKRFIRETGTAFVLSLWRPSAHHAIYAARLTEVEVCAALARRHKGLKLAADQFHKSVKRLRRDFTERLAVTATTESIVIEALRLAESYALRGYDALQPRVWRLMLSRSLSQARGVAAGRRGGRERVGAGD